MAEPVFVAKNSDIGWLASESQIEPEYCLFLAKAVKTACSFALNRCTVTTKIRVVFNIYYVLINLENGS